MKRKLSCIILALMLSLVSFGAFAAGEDQKAPAQPAQNQTAPAGGAQTGETQAAAQDANAAKSDQAGHRPAVRKVTPHKISLPRLTAHRPAQHKIRLHRLTVHRPARRKIKMHRLMARLLPVHKAQTPSQTRHSPKPL